MNYKSKAAELNKLTIELFLMGLEGRTYSQLWELKKKSGFTRPDFKAINRGNYIIILRYPDIF
jgi:hypothetical protein